MRGQRREARSVAIRCFRNARREAAATGAFDTAVMAYIRRSRAVRKDVARQGGCVHPRRRGPMNIEVRDMTIEDFCPADEGRVDDAQFCAYCGKAGATAPHKGEMFHGRCINLVLLYHIPRRRFLVRSRQRSSR